MAATRKKQDPAALDSISVAFVTFEHEESKRRCLEDYRYSRRGFCRYQKRPTRSPWIRQDAWSLLCGLSVCGREYTWYWYSVFEKAINNTTPE